jgi:hypothetical protein
MALTIEVPVRSSSVGLLGGSLPRDRRDVYDAESAEPTAAIEHVPIQSRRAGRMEVLLDEPAFALWATEASLRYEVSTLDALELLAYALFLDGER